MGANRRLHSSILRFLSLSSQALSESGSADSEHSDKTFRALFTFPRYHSPRTRQGEFLDCVMRGVRELSNIVGHRPQRTMNFKSFPPTRRRPTSTDERHPGQLSVTLAGPQLDPDDAVLPRACARPAGESGGCAISSPVVTPGTSFGCDKSRTEKVARNASNDIT